MGEIPCLLELELCSPWFDASAPRRAGAADPGDGPPVQPASAAAGPPRLLLLLAPPRSGSYHLSRLLWLHGYGRPLEYLNPHLRQPLARFSPSWPRPEPRLTRLARRLGGRFGADQRPWGWWQRLVAERSTLSSRSGIPFFAIKLQRGQAGNDAAGLRERLEPLARRGLWRWTREDPPRLIALFRSNWRRAVLSHHLSLATGAFDQGRIMSFQQRPITALGDPADLAEDLAAYRRQLEWLLDAVEQLGVPAQVIEHEALVRNQPGVLADLFAALEAPAVATGGPSLELRISRESSAWAPRREAWLDQLQQAFEAAGLDRHPEARRAQELVERLRERTLTSSR